MPTNAIAIVLERGNLPVKYYGQVPVEPIPDGTVVTVTRAVSVKANMISLLRYIATARPANVVLVSHGEGSGISVTLTDKSQTALVSPHLQTLVDNKGKVSAQLAQELEISERSLRALQDAAGRVRALHLGRVDFRSCTLGEFADTLELLRSFFGAGAVSAPKNLDEYGGTPPIGPKTTAESWTKWREDHPFGKVEGDPPNRVGFETSNAVSALQYESKAGLRGWLGRNFPGHRYREGKVYYHGILVADSIVLPGERAYLDHLGHAP
ncbi:MAG: hypothetical protein HOV79_03350 [Hamadaea sp.]|nr:hypothetical protein [Hamadaea sp.]